MENEESLLPLSEEKTDETSPYDRLSVSCEILNEFSYPLYHVDALTRASKGLPYTPWSFFQRLEVKNPSGETLPGLMLEFSFESEAFGVDDIVLPPLPSPSSSLRLPYLKVSLSKLPSLTSTLPSSVTIKLIRTDDGRVLCTLTKEFKILPLGQLTHDINDDPRIYAKYVTPLEPRVKELANKAVLHHDGTPFLAYQNKDANDMLKELKALYDACHDANILYQNPPAGESVFQRLRLPSECLRDKKATCIDMTLLFASLVLEVGYHPILVVTKDHAFVGVFLKNNDSFQGGKTEKVNDLHSRLGGGAVFLETTLLCSGSSAPFQDALSQGKEHLTLFEDKDIVGIDVTWCHRSTYGPIPSLEEEVELVNYLNAKEIEDKDLSPLLVEEHDKVDTGFHFDRFETWKIKLLDLSEKNRLVRFNIDPSSCVRLLSADVVQSLLGQDELRLVLPDAPNADIVASFMTVGNDAFDAYLQTLSSDQILAFGLERTLQTLLKKAKSAEEETGASPLYLCLGMLSYTSPKSRKRSRAPFLLLPVSIKKTGVGKTYVLSYDLGDLTVNETFFEYYKSQVDRDANYASLYGFNDLSRYGDLSATFKSMGDDITLDENFFFLSNVSFAHQVMWLDMEKRKQELYDNLIVKSIVDSRSYIHEETIGEDVNIDSLENYRDFAAPLYYDSSQLKAILDCGDGKSFILDGPPGTGKSQTIVNMIANAFYQGRKVLFVAEKKAALDVVADRLQRLGLGNYCLELHSSKATKGDFFRKLGKVMEFGPTKTPEEYEKLCEDLTARKNALRATLDKMHDTSTCPYSLYDSILATRELQYLKDHVIPLSEEFVRGYDEEKSRRVTQLLDTFQSLSKEVPHFETSPLRALGKKQLNFILDKPVLLEDFTKADASFDAFFMAVKAFFSRLPFKVEMNLKNIDAMLVLFHYAYEEKLLRSGMDAFLRGSADLDEALKKAKQFKDHIASLEKRMDALAILENLDVKALVSSFRNANGIFKRHAVYKNIKAELTPYVHESISAESLGNLMLVLEDLNRRYKELSSLDETFHSYTGKDASTVIKEYEEILASYQKTAEYLHLCNEFARSTAESFEATLYFLSLAKSQDVGNKISYDSLKAAREEFQATLDLLREKYLLREEILSKGDYFTNLKSLLAYVKDGRHYEEVVSLINVNKLDDGFAEEGLSALRDKVLFGEIANEEMADLLKLSLCEESLRIYFADEEVNSFSSAYFNDQIEAYKKAIDDYSKVCVEAISAKISAKFARNDMNYAPSGAIGTLRRFCANNGRGLSIRRALTDYGEAILEYLPCFLMSPLSAAQYLSVDSKDSAFNKFDIVIFDEASQIPTHEAIGPIARGKSLIVAGDPKQMPPSPYFSAGLQIVDDDEENDLGAFADSPSLLDECLAISLPRHRLNYHYRSKHESLIEFSNANFYHGGLYTFPSSSTNESEVRFEFVKPKVAKKDSSLSNEEKEAILDIFKDIYTSPKTKMRSLGVICFNITQAEKVNDAISDLLSQNPQLNEAYEAAKAKTGEPYFVKSIENVQGDERDIIILSVGFSLGKDGHPVIRGPLVAGDNNGSRRLNVAASRAKERMYIVSTIKSSQFLPDSEIKNPGAKCLKNFLKYAEESANSALKTRRLPQSSLLTYLKADLEKRGYICQSNVGNGCFAVDLALRKPEQDHYELGIIFDERGLSSSITCRDKLYVQESVLNAMKWKILRVYGLEYFKMPKATLEKIDQAFAADYVQIEHRLDVQLQQEDASVLGDAYGAKDFVLPAPVPLYYDSEYGFDPSIVEIIDALITESSPISYNLIRAYIASCADFHQFNPEREKRLKAILNQHFYTRRKLEQGQYFYYADEEMKVFGFRKAGIREIEDICDEEIVLAMNAILERDPGITQDDLYHQLMLAFAFKTHALTRIYKERFDLAYLSLR